jgi:hypothetical protein
MTKKDPFVKQVEEIHRLRREYNKGNFTHEQFIAKLESLEQEYQQIVNKFGEYIKERGD